LTTAKTGKTSLLLLLMSHHSLIAASSLAALHPASNASSQRMSVIRTTQQLIHTAKTSIVERSQNHCKYQTMTKEMLISIADYQVKETTEATMSYLYFYLRRFLLSRRTRKERGLRGLRGERKKES
jgi:hypothetical protein